MLSYLLKDTHEHSKVLWGVCVFASIKKGSTCYIINDDANMQISITSHLNVKVAGLAKSCPL